MSGPTVRSKVPSLARLYSTQSDRRRNNSGETATGRAAEAAGADVVDGLEVLVAQGAASFERWTGVAAPVGAMRSALGLGPQ